jgi:SAM-dependent methyltransferase
MTQALNWSPEQDTKYIREGAQALQAELHRRIYDPNFKDAVATRAFLESPRTYWRRTALEKFQIFKGGPISGQVLEIGAGTGWCAAWLSRLPHVEKVYAVEYDAYAVEHLMPKVFAHADARADKIVRVLGSFNHMPEAHGRMDMVVSIGAIHHSENLLATLTEVGRALKPGGYFVALEPCEPNSLSQREQEALGEREDPAAMRKYGRKVRNKENSDHYYRLCEFEAAALWSGLDAWSYVFDRRGSWLGSNDRAFRARRTYDGLRKIVLRPYFAKRQNGAPVFDRLLLIAQKPE